MDNLSKDNLLSKTSGNEVEADKSIVKISVLAVLGVGFSFFFGYFLKLFLAGGSYDLLLFSFLAAILFLTFFLLKTIYIKNLWLSVLIILGETVAFSASFFGWFSKTFLTGLLISFLLLILGCLRGRRELEDTLKIRLWRINRRTVSSAVLGLAVFVGLVYALVVGPEIEGREFFIPENTFERIISPIAGIGIIQNFFPGLDFSQPAGKMLEDLTLEQAKKDSRFALLPEDVKKELISQSLTELENKVSDFLGAPLDPEEKVSGVIYGVIINKFYKLPDNVKSLTPVILAALISLVLIGLSWPIRFIVSIITFLFYEVFLALGFSSISLEGKSKEVVILK